MTAPFTPEQEKRIRELIGEAIVETIFRTAHSAAIAVLNAVDFLDQGESITPPESRRGAYD